PLAAARCARGAAAGAGRRAGAELRRRSRAHLLPLPARVSAPPRGLDRASWRRRRARPQPDHLPGAPDAPPRLRDASLPLALVGDRGHGPGRPLLRTDGSVPVGAHPRARSRGASGGAARPLPAAAGGRRAALRPARRSGGAGARLRGLDPPRRGPLSRAGRARRRHALVGGAARLAPRAPPARWRRRWADALPVSLPRLLHG